MTVGSPQTVLTAPLLALRGLLLLGVLPSVRCVLPPTLSRAWKEGLLFWGGGRETAPHKGPHDATEERRNTAFFFLCNSK